MKKLYAPKMSPTFQSVFTLIFLMEEYKKRRDMAKTPHLPGISLQSKSLKEMRNYIDSAYFLLPSSEQQCIKNFFSGHKKEFHKWYLSHLKRNSNDANLVVDILLEQPEWNLWFSLTSEYKRYIESNPKRIEDISYHGKKIFEYMKSNFPNWHFTLKDTEELLRGVKFDFETS